MNNKEFNNILNKDFGMFFDINELYLDSNNYNLENKLELLRSLKDIKFCIKNINNKYIINLYIDEIISYFLYINLEYRNKFEIIMNNLELNFD